ncbi:MAG: VOC family protein [Pseudomonadales bacterium]|jgi:methylmalonyl-CoA/ethylmalonyl-CoA epimerase|nr:VOC family protein [Pseudomonadales bacterium]MDP6472123.1 VOC family protein [Pseudomonadales bacterium]MDP6826625.1 VOC family protein [Pseudomonadales bacterium]MDP6970104.1 VOC family protein [Pseudomonadales bacterium]|tara:strand:- start:1160 stop:1588 length:429 start_codon:yes stop_codon:yes gene_type:complete
MLHRLDHVSIGVLDMEKAKTLFGEVLGGRPLPDQGESEPEGFGWVTFLLGGKKIELVTPHVAGEGGIGQYLAKNGEGFHHLSCAVLDLEEARAHFETKGIRILGYNDVSPAFKHFYLHPKDTFGALIQVFEESEATLSLAGE